MSNVIRISNNVQDLTGQGTEYLVVDGIVIAKFYNGELVKSVPVDYNADTVTAA